MIIEGTVKQRCPFCDHTISVLVYTDTDTAWADAQNLAEDKLDNHMKECHARVSPRTLARMVEKFLEDSGTGWTWQELCSGIEVGEIRP